jgi:hypothetical protein
MRSNFLLNLIGTLMISSFLLAQVPASQEVISIPSGQSNAGLLETTINGDVDGNGDRINPNRIYLLEPGLHFMLSAIDVADNSGTIKIHGSTTGKKPVIVPLVENGVAPGTSNIRASLELKNLHIQGRNDEGGGAEYFFQVYGNDRSIHVEDCLVEFTVRFIKAQDVPQGLTMTFKNNYFRDLFVTGQQWSGNVVDAKGVPLESFIFENNTVTNAGCPVLLQNQVIKYALINHNTFVNTSTFWNLNPYFYEAYITNNLFYNANMMGEDYNYLQANPGEVSFPIMAFAPISMDGNANASAIPADMLNAAGDALVAPYDDVANYKIYVADNIYHNESSLDSYYNGDYNTIANNPISYIGWFGVAGPHDVNVPANWMAARETALFANNASWVEENNILDQDPQLATVALSAAESTQQAVKLRKWYEVPDENTAEDMSSIMFGDFDPLTIPGVGTEDGDGIVNFYDLIEDFTIASSFVSNIDGHSIGALHWSSEIDSYDSAQALADIQQAYGVNTGDVISIPSGQSNAGLLETTINGDVDGNGDRINPNRIYLLEPGLHFMLSAIDVADNSGTIKIHGSTTGKKPVIVPLVENGVAPGTSNIRASLELKNLHIQGRNDEGGGAEYFFQVYGNDRSIHVEDCLVEFTVRFIKAQDVPQGLTMTFKNNYFRDLFVTGQQWSGNVVDAKGVPLESFIFENNTVTNAGCPVLLQNQVIKYALINHNTFVNTSTFWNLNPYFYEAYITNNLFYNANMMGEDYNYLKANPGEVSFPIMAFAPISMDGNANASAIPADMLNAAGDALVAPYDDVANYKIYVADNIYHNESSLDSYYNGDYNTIANNPISYIGWFGVAGPHDVNVPANWMAARETALFANNASWVEENNILDQDPQLATVALSAAESTQQAVKLRKWYEVPDENTAEDMSSIMFGDFDPLTIPGVGTEDGDGIVNFYDLIEDFTIASSFVSNIDGHSIGALHWSSEIDSYDSAQALANIQGAYTSTLSIVDVNDSENIASLVSFPNPFTNNLSIKFNMITKSNVDVSLYSITGAKVATLVKETLHAGNHHLNFDTTSLSKGLYLCKIEAGQYTKTFKVIKSE